MIAHQVSAAHLQTLAHHSPEYVIHRALYVSSPIIPEANVGRGCIITYVLHNLIINCVRPTSWNIILSNDLATTLMRFNGEARWGWNAPHKVVYSFGRRNGPWLNTILLRWSSNLAHSHQRTRTLEVYGGCIASTPLIYDTRWMMLLNVTDRKRLAFRTDGQCHDAE